MEKRYPDTITMLSECLVREEYSDTAPLIMSLSHVRARGHFTRDEFLEMCTWKESRQRTKRYWLANTEQDVVTISGAALGAPDEARRILRLCRLKGVGVPVASALLTLIDPDTYGVIDFRVWQILALYDEVDYDPSGSNLELLHWLDCLDKLRIWASQLRVTVRAVERTLWQHPKDIQLKPRYSSR